MGGNISTDKMSRIRPDPDPPTMADTDCSRNLFAGRGPGPGGEAAGQLQCRHVSQALGLSDLRVS